jgi:hypothetical protein
MSDGENLVLEHLRAIRGTLSEHGERLNRIELRLAAIEQTRAACMPCLAVIGKP